MGHETPPTAEEMRREVAAEMADLRASDALRQRPEIVGGNGRFIQLVADGRRQKLINWASNDYLGGLQRVAVRNGAARALRQEGPGAGSARLLSGGLQGHRRLERRLAHWFDREEALLTTTGYQANLATLVALVSSSEDVAVLDRLCHASSYDGLRMSAGTMQRFAHNDPIDLRRQLRRSSGARRRVVCVESVYSMDGDEAPLADLATVCEEEGALLVVDEAHAIGVFGPGGRGLAAEQGVRPFLMVGTCSKSLAAQGGFIVGDEAAIELIVNRGRSFIYSTAPVPAAVGAALAMLDQLRKEPDLGENLLAAAADFRSALAAQGWQLGIGRGPIIPVMTGTVERTLALATALRNKGHFAPAIRPPTVPPGRCRLRLTLTAAHRAVDRRRLLEALLPFAPGNGEGEM